MTANGPEAALKALAVEPFDVMLVVRTRHSVVLI